MWQYPDSPGITLLATAPSGPVVPVSGVPGFAGLAAKAFGPQLITRPQDLPAGLRDQGVPWQLAPWLQGLPAVFHGQWWLAETVDAFFANGGTRCYVAAGPGAEGLAAAITALGGVPEVDLLAAPDAMALPKDEALEVQRALVAQCAAQGDRFALLDALPQPLIGDLSIVDALGRQRDALRRNCSEPLDAALYHPWLKTRPGRAIPPCGAVAGVIARTDAQTGAHRAPANAWLDGVFDLELPVDAATHDALNPLGVNCIRALPGRGIRILGARTLSDDPAFRYVNVRRVVLGLRRWIAGNMRWAAFEPNDPALWQRIERELGQHLASLWQRGALAGGTAAEAFSVRCNAETNPPGGREAGHVVTEIALRPSQPAEFILLRLTQREGLADLMPR
jgi:hypothetical protein